MANIFVQVVLRLRELLPLQRYAEGRGRRDSSFPTPATRIL